MERKGTRPLSAARTRERGHRKKGVYGIEARDAEDTSAEIRQDLGDIDLCVFENFLEVSTWQPEGLPPGLGDLDTFGTWAKFLCPCIKYDPWE